MVVTGVVQREPFLQLIALQQEWVASVDPTFPLLERWPPGHPPQAPYYPMGVPIHLEGVAGGTVNLHCTISWVRSSMSWCSSWSLRPPSSAWRQCSVPPLGGVCWGGVCGSPSPVVGFECQTIVYVVLWASEGATVLTMIASSRNSNTLTMLQLAHFNYSTVLKRTTDSVAK